MQMIMIYFLRMCLERGNFNSCLLLLYANERKDVSFATAGDDLYYYYKIMAHELND